MATITRRIQAYVKGGKLTGQVLHVRTGALRRSIGGQVEDVGGEVVGRVGIFGGPTEPYGRAHEYGVSKTVSVKEHFRTIKEAFGRPIAPTAVRVREHTMKLNLPERSYLRSTLAE